LGQEEKSQIWVEMQMFTFNKMFQRFSLCALLTLGIGTQVKADSTGYGVLGDSFADEYQFYPPDRSTARNFVELLATDRNVNFGSFTTVSRGDPRNQGYANDWALNGAESGGLATQTAGLAQQVAAGQVKTAFMFVGGNDFLDALQSPNAQTLLPAIPQALLTNVITAATTILGANPNAGIVISNLFDVSMLPVVQQALAQGLVTQAELQGVSQLVNGYNQALAAAVAGNSRIAIVDMNGLSQKILSAPTFSVGGVNIDRTTPGDQYTHLFLADGLHIGTVGQGLLANAFIDAADKQFSAGITPLSPGDIIQSARSVPAAVPTPRAWEISVVGLLIVAVVSTKFGRRILH
jgi:hypothetical protein